MSGVCIRMPPAPCTSGSTITAATSPPRAARNSSSRFGVERQADGVEQQRLERAEEQRVAADGHRPERVAVVAVLERRRSSVRCGSPRWHQNWYAIFNATSTAVLPLSE